MFCLSRPATILWVGWSSVGDEVEGLFDGGDAEGASDFVEQGAAIADGPHQSLMDAHGEQHGEEAGGGLNEQGLTACSGGGP